MTLGFREAPSGVHLSKTMMLAELIAVMDAPPARDTVTQAVLVGDPLRLDDGAMAVMIFGDVPALAAVVDSIATLEGTASR